MLNFEQKSYRKNAPSSTAGSFSWLWFFLTATSFAPCPSHWWNLCRHRRQSQVPPNRAVGVKIVLESILEEIVEVRMEPFPVLRLSQQSHQLARTPPANHFSSLAGGGRFLLSLPSSLCMRICLGVSPPTTTKTNAEAKERYFFLQFRAKRHTDITASVMMSPGQSWQKCSNTRIGCSSKPKLQAQAYNISFRGGILAGVTWTAGRAKQWETSSSRPISTCTRQRGVATSKKSGGTSAVKLMSVEALGRRIQNHYSNPIAPQEASLLGALFDRGTVGRSSRPRCAWTTFCI